MDGAQRPDLRFHVCLPSAPAPLDPVPAAFVVGPMAIHPCGSRPGPDVVVARHPNVGAPTPVPVPGGPAVLPGGWFGNALVPDRRRLAFHVGESDDWDRCDDRDPATGPDDAGRAEQGQGCRSEEGQAWVHGEAPAKESGLGAVCALKEWTQGPRQGLKDPEEKPIGATGRSGPLPLACWRTRGRACSVSNRSYRR